MSYFREIVFGLRKELYIAVDVVHVYAEADRKELAADGSDASFVMISLQDENGIRNLQAKKKLTVSVAGAGILQGVGNADPATENRYQQNTWETYDGYLLAVVRTTGEPGEITVTVSDESGDKAELLLTSKG